MLTDCYGEDEVNAMKDHQVESILKQLERRVGGWDSSKCPVVSEYLERQAGDDNDAEEGDVEVGDAEDGDAEEGDAEEGAEEEGDEGDESEDSGEGDNEDEDDAEEGDDESSGPILISSFTMVL